MNPQAARVNEEALYSDFGVKPSDTPLPAPQTLIEQYAREAHEPAVDPRVEYDTFKHIRLFPTVYEEYDDEDASLANRVGVVSSVYTLFLERLRHRARAFEYWLRFKRCEAQRDEARNLASELLRRAEKTALQAAQSSTTPNATLDESFSFARGATPLESKLTQENAILRRRCDLAEENAERLMNHNRELMRQNVELMSDSARFMAENTSLRLTLKGVRGGSSGAKQ